MPGMSSNVYRLERILEKFCMAQTCCHDFPCFKCALADLHNAAMQMSDDAKRCSHLGPAMHHAMEDHDGVHGRSQEREAG
jgi:hypothetical protein